MAVDLCGFVLIWNMYQDFVDSLQSQAFPNLDEDVPSTVADTAWDWLW